MKLVERIFENRIRQQIDIDDNDMQFGFMKGKGTTDAIFIVRQMQEKFRAKGKKLCFGFVDFEKATDRVLREVIKWGMCKLVSIGSHVWCKRSCLRTVYGNSNSSEVKVGRHQGSA